jgi:hypothetical protein
MSQQGAARPEKGRISDSYFGHIDLLLAAPVVL